LNSLRLQRPILFLALVLGFVPLCAPAQSLPRREEDPIPPQVENIYTRGLRYLSASQQEDGAWAGVVGQEPGVVGLCIKAFLARGEDPNYGPYSKNIQASVNYVLSKQKPTNGYIGRSMYSHAFATLALAECYGMLPDERIGPALEQAVALILSAQKRNPHGAWRYNPQSSDADSTVSGCQLVALYAARNAGIPVPDEAFTKGLKYMAKCRNGDGGYGYTSSVGEKPTLTAIGVLCHSLAKKTDTRTFAASTKSLSKRLNFRDKYYPYYFEYYMSQALFHADDELFDEWNVKNIKYLGTIQAPDGSFPGDKGEAFSTAGALLSLALNYRLLPIYEK